MPFIGDKIARRAERIYREVKPFALYGIILLAGYLLLPVVSPYFSRPEVLAIIVGVLAIAIINVSREAARKPSRPNKKFLNKLLRSEPIIPKHDPPKAGGNFSSMADTDEGKRFFADFAPFAEIMNEWLADEYVGSRWRLQDLPDWDVRLNVDYSYGPTIGRSYDVFHNQVKLGRLEIRPGYPYSPQAPNVITEVQLDSVRLLSFNSIASFLSGIAAYVCDDKAHYEKHERHSDANQAITAALTEALWSNQQITEFEDLDGQGWGELYLHLQGRASHSYFKRREALQAKRRSGQDDGRALVRKLAEEMGEAVKAEMERQGRKQS
jgi:hypothetical protein